MIKRIVCMEIYPERIPEVEKILSQNFNKIKSFKGCLHLEILRDKNEPNRFFSYSEWKSVDDLENYRSSEFFGMFWRQLRKNFQAKAKAWTLESVPLKLE